MNGRKVVGVATLSMDDDQEGTHGEVVAVADDGTLWKGGVKCVNHEQVSFWQKEYNRCIKEGIKDAAIAMTIGQRPLYKYDWLWEQLPPLPGDTSNFTRVK